MAPLLQLKAALAAAVLVVVDVVVVVVVVDVEVVDVDVVVVVAELRVLQETKQVNPEACTSLLVLKRNLADLPAVRIVNGDGVPHILTKSAFQ